MEEAGIAVKSVPDQRWARRDIKTVCLLPQVMAKRIAKAEGCDEAWMIEDGFVTEGASSTAYIITGDRKIITRGNSNKTLPGCTRLAALQLAKEAGFTLEERPFTLQEAMNADEACLTSASNFVVSVTKIDGKPVGDGKPGRDGKTPARSLSRKRPPHRDLTRSIFENRPYALDNGTAVLLGTIKPDIHGNIEALIGGTHQRAAIQLMPHQAFRHPCNTPSRHRHGFQPHRHAALMHPLEFRQARTQEIAQQRPEERCFS